MVDERDKLISLYKQLLCSCRPVMRKGDTRIIRNAFDLAMEKSGSQKTFDDEAGIYYPLRLALILALETGLGTTSIVAALLQDAYTQQKIDKQTVLEQFNTSVLNILDGLVKISSIRTERTAFQSENFIRFLLSFSGDVHAILIKMADCLYHLRINKYLPVQLQKTISNEAFYLYAPTAHRLGLYNIKSELEDLSMQSLFPDAYNDIVSKLKETKNARKLYFQEFLQPVEQALAENGLSVEIKSRTKSIHSIWEKMKTQGVSFEEVYDLLAVRLIINKINENEKADCWRVYSIVTDIYPPNPERLRDWVSAPKASGYESLHTTVLGPKGKWVEVQIRTARMDNIAEKGHAAHWRYKEPKSSDDPTLWMKNIQELLEGTGKQKTEPSEPRGPEREAAPIFVFTPGKDLKKLPAGASVLDFAFEVHTTVGSHCTGARVNGKIVPIKQVLSNGDEVEILTSKNQKPKKDWLSLVITGRAKAKIRRALKEDELKEAERGKESLSRKMKSWKVPFTDDSIDKIIKALKFKTPIDLYQAIATQRIELSRIKESLFAISEKAENRFPVPEEARERQSTKAAAKEDFIFLDQHLAGINYTLASCCNPIFGDEVFGFVTISKGVTIHRAACPNAHDLKAKFDYRILPVRWGKSSSTGSFQATLKVMGIDELGVVNTLSDVISNDMKVNIRSIAIDSNNGIFEGLIKVFISDTKHLEMLIHRLSKTKGILKVSRYDPS